MLHSEPTSFLGQCFFRKRPKDVRGSLQIPIMRLRLVICIENWTKVNTLSREWSASYQRVGQNLSDVIEWKVLTQPPYRQSFYLEIKWIIISTIKRGTHVWDFFSNSSKSTIGLVQRFDGSLWNLRVSNIQ